MPNPFLKQHNLFFPLILLLMMNSSCIGTNPVTPTKLYILTPENYQQDETDRLVKGIKQIESISVEILPVRLPQYLKKPQIVTRIGSNQLAMAEYHQWGGNLGKNINRVMAQNVAGLLGTPHVSIAPYRPPIPSQFRIETEIMQFEKGSDEQVRLRAHWRLYNGNNKIVLVTRMTDLKRSLPPDGYGFEQIVSAMGSLLSDLNRIICEQMVHHAGLRPVP